MASTEAPRVAIVGAGFAGSATAAQLLRQATGPLNITLLERRFPIGSGRAFATTLPCHLLNVPAGRMSAYPDDPEHLLRWLGAGVPGYTFLPRATYGTYVHGLLPHPHSERPAPAWTSRWNGTIWSAWSEAERRRFTRHARPYWEVHRHRMAPENAETIARLHGLGRLRVLAARIAGVVETPDGLEIALQHRGGSRHETIRTAKLTNCTGPPLKGLYWETTAVPEIRLQAQTLAHRLISEAA